MTLRHLIAATILGTTIALTSAAYAGSGHDHGDGHKESKGHDHGSQAVHDDHGDHGHDDHTSATPEFEHKDYGSTASAWIALNKAVQDSEEAVDGNKLGAVHGIYPELAASAHYLLDHSDLDDEATQTRLKAALTQLTGTVESFHEYSHSGKDYAKEAGRELKKMQGALKLIGTYYPAEQFSAE